MWYVFEIFKPHSQYLLGKMVTNAKHTSCKFKTYMWKKSFNSNYLKYLWKLFTNNDPFNTTQTLSAKQKFGISIEVNKPIGMSI